MEIIKPKSAINNRSNKLAKTFHKLISLTNASKVASNNGICMLKSQPKCKENPSTQDVEARNVAVMEALVARLFAGATAIKAAYAELQMAQQPYNSEAIQEADQKVVEELTAISDLKRRFLKKDLNFSPQVTIMLAEIQEQQSWMRTYQIMIKKIESDVEFKDSEIDFLSRQMDDCVAFNKSLERKLNSSGCLLILDNLEISALNLTHFVQFLQYALRAVRSFVKMMIREMESAHWDLEAVVKFIHPEALFTKPSHRFFAFESYVCLIIFEGFNFPNFVVPTDPFEKDHQHSHSQSFYFEKFKKLKSLNPKQYLTHNPNSSFAGFMKTKYLQLVHSKMECSLFGNLNQREVLSSGGCPDSKFFLAFAQMAKRIWTLHYLALSFGEQISVFQVKKNSRFSEVYMECITEESVSPSSENAIDSGDLRVGFTVVPGFKIEKAVIQSLVYLSPVGSPASC